MESVKHDTIVFVFMFYFFVFLDFELSYCLQLVDQMSEQSNSSYEDLDAIEATSEEGRMLNNLFSSRNRVTVVPMEKERSAPEVMI